MAKSDYWRIVPIGEVAEVKKGTNFTSKQVISGEVPVIAGGREPAYYHQHSNRPANTITVSASGEAGYVSFHREPIFATDCTTIRSKSNMILTSYIYHYLKYNQKQLYRLRTGSALPHLYPRDLSRFKLCFPPLSQQRKISDALDNIDDIIERTKNVMIMTGQLHDVLLRTLLIQGLPGYHTEWKEASGIGTIPTNWQVVRLGEIVDIIGGSTPSRKIEEYWGSDIPWVVPSELTELTGRYLTSTRESITTAGLQSCSLRVIPSKSVLLTTRATIGAAAINLVPVTTNQGFQNLVPKSELDILWLYYYMLFSKRDLIRLASGSTFRELTRDSIRSITIACPPIQEQIAIANLLDMIDIVLELYRIEQDMLLTTGGSLSNFFFKE